MLTCWLHKIRPWAQDSILKVLICKRLKDTMLESMTTYMSVCAKSIHNEEAFIVVAREGFWTESPTKSASQEPVASHWPVAHWVDVKNSLSWLLWISQLSHLLPWRCVGTSFSLCLVLSNHKLFSCFWSMKGVEWIPDYEVHSIWVPSKDLFFRVGRVLSCSLSWSWTHNPPDFVFWGSGCTTTHTIEAFSN